MSDAEAREIEAARAEERERCAKACETEGQLWPDENDRPQAACLLCAVRIRALGPATGEGEA